jgi:3'-phosphoadenosine 5'-phosphosulfate sulfotransferase (PAPS reductase)/FAD synthetase
MTGREVGVDGYNPPDPKGTMVIASVSGGKDSLAMSLWLTEQGIEHKRVFADTGWEHEDTIEYVRDYLPSVLGPIDTVSGDLQMADLIKSKAMFPSRVRRFCTVELKVKPIIRYVQGLDPERHAINAVGLRAAESRARAKLDEWEHDANGFERWVWRPLITWSEQDVIDIIRRHGVRPNPLYLKGAERVGCWPCIFSRKAEIKNLARLSPGRIEEIEALEAVVSDAAEERYAARGETFESLGYKPPTFFQARLPDPDGKWPGWPIRKVVDWSRTARGGRQLELFEDPAEPGCVRWGLCDMAGEG